MTSSCFLCTSHFHFLIGRFQVAFMRTKLISVSKFSREKKGKEKSLSRRIVLVSSPVLRACSVFVFTTVLFLNTGGQDRAREPGLV